MSQTWQPSWWNDTHASTWDRFKEAITRDWQQTKHDLHLPGGHELNQNIGDTVAQSAGKEAIPPRDKANPPEVIGSLGDDEIPLRYGHAAREHYHTAWSAEVESKLKDEWEQGRDTTRRGWDDVRVVVRHGWDRAKS
jgi:hypothetical protein